jgi:hypothetical protein
MKARLEEGNMKNWEKMMKYMALCYLTPCSDPFGSGFSHLHLF